MHTFLDSVYFTIQVNEIRWCVEPPSVKTGITFLIFVIPSPFWACASLDKTLKCCKTLLLLFRKGIFDEYSQITSLVTEEIVNVHKEIQGG